MRNYLSFDSARRYMDIDGVFLETAATRHFDCAHKSGSKGAGPSDEALDSGTPVLGASWTFFFPGVNCAEPRVKRGSIFISVYNGAAAPATNARPKLLRIHIIPTRDYNTTSSRC